MWKYESYDNKNISLHDHYIDKIFVDGNDIWLIFSEGFDVVKTHPLNDTGKSKHTTTSQIILRNADFIEQDEMDFVSLINSTFSFEVLDWTMERNIEDGVIILNGEFTEWSDTGFKKEFAQLKFTCSDFLFCWNDYSEDAWFEGWPERSE